MVQKIVNAKAKAGLKSSIMVRNSNICCYKGLCLSNSISIVLKMLTQETTAKKSHFKKSRSKKIKPAKKKTFFLLRDNVA